MEVFLEALRKETLTMVGRRWRYGRMTEFDEKENV
jgi:hypothetical protein